MSRARGPRRAAGGQGPTPPAPDRAVVELAGGMVGQVYAYARHHMRLSESEAVDYAAHIFEMTALRARDVLERHAKIRSVDEIKAMVPRYAQHLADTAERLADMSEWLADVAPWLAERLADGAEWPADVAPRLAPRLAEQLANVANVAERPAERLAEVLADAAERLREQADDSYNLAHFLFSLIEIDRGRGGAAP